VDEFELIRRFFLQHEQGTGVSIGIGDDGAVVTPSPGRRLVVVADTIIAGVHYPPVLPASDVGYRAVAVNLSDVAAMGGVPRWMTLALTLTQADGPWLEDFAKGLFAAAREHDVALVGGDTTRGSQTVITVHLLGEVRPDAILVRGGANPGEGIYVTGTVGDAAGGLALLQEEASGEALDDANYLIRRFSRPTARVALGAALAEVATAAIDLSDGLGTDLAKLLHASNVGGVLDLHALPMSPSLRRMFPAERVQHFALDGGDDYELCFTARAADHERVAALGAYHGTAITRIGTTERSPGLFCARNGIRLPYEDRGYRHF
jgi:thiamine-monophosphate kinase